MFMGSAKLACRNENVPKAFAHDAASADNDFNIIRFKIGSIRGETDIDKLLRDVSDGATCGANKVVVIPDVWIEADDACFIDFLEQAVVTQEVEGVVNRCTRCHREALIDMDTNVFSGWVM